MNSKGSITIYICLVMTIILSLILAGVRSVKIAGGRLQMVSAVDLGLYSLFGQYDKDLLEQYHLLFLDGGYGQSKLQMGQLYSSLEDDMSCILFPEGKSNSFTGKNIWELSMEGGSITGYSLATDGDGIIFKEQAIDYMEKTLGAQGVQLLLNRMNKEADTVKTQQDNKERMDSGEALQEYEQLEAGAVQDSEGDPREEVSVDPEFINPIEVIRNIKKMGILMLAVPDAANISTKETNLSKCVSKRSLNQGMGLVPYSRDVDSFQGNVLFQEYIMQNCGNYTHPFTESELEYQVEYILQGKSSDMENLKGVIYRLLLIREAANAIYLATDPGKKAQLSATALTIAMAIGLPQAEQIVEGILLACWAYAESILDIRELLDGGKVALMKTSSTWQVSVENLAHLSEGMDSIRKSTEGGLDYSGYLRILLSMKEGEGKGMRCMDVIEQSMNGREGKQNFRLDCCIASLEVEMQMSASKRLFTILRDYGYDM